MITTNDTAIPASVTTPLRLDGTPITPTCEIPLKSCCREVLLGECCDCGGNDLGDLFDQPIFLDLRPQVAA